ncbi:MAG: hypothetical protein R3C52_06605 [Hyphomonadaceae bacterium]
MIRKILATAAVVTALSGAAFAQEAGEASASKFKIDTTTIGEILDNEDAKAAFVKVMPELALNDQIEQGRDFTLQAVADMGYADPTKFPELQAEFDKIQ